MEKPFVLFTTALGLGVLGLGLVALFAAIAMLALFSPLGRVADSIAVLGGSALVAWLSFRADAWSSKRIRKSRTRA